jgi:uncharacterized repeat protein (TIGR03803 family)
VKTILRACFVLTVTLFTAANAGAIFFTNLYSFSPSTVANQALAGSYGGNYPQAALVLSGDTVYGTTASGSTNNEGTIFKYSPGAGFVSIHTFTGPDGANPPSDLVMSGNVLFGTAAYGGAYGGGTVFAVNTNGTEFTNLFSFAYTNGGTPLAGLVLSGNTLFGTTADGGAYGAGTIFAINIDGTGFTTLYNFNYTNGANPVADLLLLGNTLYGTTVFGGGSNGLGTVFAVNTNGTGFTNLIIFTGANGANPQAGLAVVSNVLCGTTVNGGNYNAGTAFLIGTNGANFNTLYNFGLAYTDGQHPYSRLVVSSNGASSYSLYGTTQIGGQPNGLGGTAFAVNISGPSLALSSYSSLYSFGSSSAVQAPVAGLALSGSTLYGTASGNGSGGVFRITTSGGSFQALHTFQPSAASVSAYVCTNSDGGNSRANLVLSGRTLYGTAAAGGTNGSVTIFALNTDGTGFTILSSLGGNDIGPWAGLVLSGNSLYGITTGNYSLGNGSYSGPNFSTIFALNTDGTGFTNISSGYSSSQGNLLLSGNTFYGTTFSGGNGVGSVFAVNTDGTGSTNLYNFDTLIYSGFSPASGLVLGGNTLYGTTEVGVLNYGTVYAINTDGTGFTNLMSFNGTNGSFPVASLVLSGNRLYGTTRSDVIRDSGTIFAVNTDGTGFTSLYKFDGYDGMWPQANLILCGNTLYGTTTAGGGGGYGTIFSIHTDGTGFTTLYNFSGGNDGANPYDGLLLSGNTLYGTTSGGGSGGNGTVFALSLGPIPLSIQPNGTDVVLTWGNPVFTLLAAPSINGTYTNVTGATSPYTNAITASPQFFRLQAQ